MNHAVIVAHPDPLSFTFSVARTYCEAVTAAGHAVTLRDLYRMDFDPRLKASEIAGRPGFAPAADIVAERDALQAIDVFAFIYPFWLNAAPAIMKGYLDRVFGLGFAFGPGPEGNRPLLAGKTMISFTSSGAPSDWAEKTGALHAESTLFDEHLARLSGLKLADHLHFGGIVPGIRADVVERHFAAVRAAAAKHFDPAAAVAGWQDEQTGRPSRDHRFPG